MGNFREGIKRKKPVLLEDIAKLHIFAAKEE